MARLPALVDVMTAIDGRPRGSIDHVARLIREACLIQTTKRGPGAATMTALDAAWLLLGLYGGDQPAEAAESAQRFADSRAMEIDRRHMPPNLQVFRSGMRLVDAIASIVELGPDLAGAGERAPPGASRGLQLPSKHAKGWATGISVTIAIIRPVAEASIVLTWTGSDERDVISREVTFLPAQSLSTAGRPIKTVVQLHTPVFSALHGLLFPEVKGA